MTYKAKSLIYLGVFASLALTYHLTSATENKVEAYVEAQEIKDVTETDKNTTVGIELEDRE
ncbi:hypothetical protein [uncultured Maribacter sp.]|uniref:hypothetical protein n=1 Tax=uncultured Maribacter sp. TaxID=431308 RepID=UPI00260F4924|nr:hypothetical protein [uncultured Maribacter sp.]